MYRVYRIHIPCEQPILEYDVPRRAKARRFSVRHSTCSTVLHYSTAATYNEVWSFLADTAPCVVPLPACLGFPLNVPVVSTPFFPSAWRVS
jgi:hypothetical protein